MDNRQGNIYTYATAGFNGFFNRSLDATPAITLGQASSNFQQVNRQSINFDHAQTTGKLGDIIQVGEIDIDGKNRRISFYDEGRVNEVGRMGNLNG